MDMWVHLGHQRAGLWRGVRGVCGGCCCCCWGWGWWWGGWGWGWEERHTHRPFHGDPASWMRLWRCVKTRKHRPQLSALNVAACVALSPPALRVLFLSNHSGLAKQEQEWLESARRDLSVLAQVKWRHPPERPRWGLSWGTRNPTEVPLIPAVVKVTGKLKRRFFFFLVSSFLVSPLGCCERTRRRDRRSGGRRRTRGAPGLDGHRRDYGSRNGFSQPHHAGAHKLAPVESQRPACGVLEQLQHTVSVCVCGGGGGVCSLYAARAFSSSTCVFSLSMRTAADGNLFRGESPLLQRAAFVYRLKYIWSTYYNFLHFLRRHHIIKLGASVGKYRFRSSFHLQTSIVFCFPVIQGTPPPPGKNRPHLPNSPIDHEMEQIFIPALFLLVLLVFCPKIISDWRVIKYVFLLGKLLQCYFESSANLFVRMYILIVHLINLRIMWIH